MDTRDVDFRSFQTSALPITEAARLTRDQRDTAWRTMLRTYEFAIAESHRESNFGDDYIRHQSTDRPQQVFLIDGSRGAGKTTMLFTIRHHLNLLGLSDVPSEQIRQKQDLTNARRFLGELFGGDVWNSIAKEIDSNSDHIFSNLKGKSILEILDRSHEIKSKRSRRTAHVLMPIFPSDLEHPHQPVMEGVFALMRQEIDDELAALKADKPVSESTRTRLHDTTELRQELLRRTSTGWYLSRAEGREAILRDSFDYRDYLSRQGDASADSYNRVIEWRRFVNRYLDHFGAQMLCVFLDDTDVSPGVTADILHTIRIFLDHPRIVTFLAGHLRSMRHSLLLREMTDLREPIETLGTTEESTPQEWRRLTRQQIEEYLEKVLPRPNRFFLGVHTTSFARHEQNRRQFQHHTGNEALSLERQKQFAAEFPKSAGKQANEAASGGQMTDFEAVTGQNFFDFCSSRLRDRSEFFHDSRFAVQYGQPVSVEDSITGAVTTRMRAETADDREQLETFIGWRLLRDRYAIELLPRTLRQIHALRRYTQIRRESPTLTERLQQEHQKRLAVILFESPANFELVQRFTDLDDKVLTWLYRQKLDSTWSGERAFEINSRKYYSGTYSYDYLSFRLDLSIALPRVESPDAGIPRDLLPTPSGPAFKARNAFYFPKNRAMKAGVSLCIDHSVIPSNCIYVADLQALPDIAWQQPPVDGKPGDPWGSALSYRWPELVHQSATVEPSTGRSVWKTDTNEPYHRVNIERMQRYFVDVVVPTAGLEFSHFAVQNVAALDLGADGMPTEIDADREDAGAAPFAPMLIAECRQGFFQRSIKVIEQVRRHTDYFWQLGQSAPTGINPVSGLARNALLRFRNDIMEPVPPTNESGVGLGDFSVEQAALKKCLGDYQLIVSDIRKSWHAGRIFIRNSIDFDYPRQIAWGIYRRASEDAFPEKIRDAIKTGAIEIIPQRLARTDLYKIPSRQDLEAWFTAGHKDALLNSVTSDIFRQRWFRALPEEPIDRSDANPANWKRQKPNEYEKRNIASLADITGLSTADRVLGELVNYVGLGASATSLPVKDRLRAVLTEGARLAREATDPGANIAIQSEDNISWVPPIAATSENVLGEGEFDFANCFLMFLWGVGPTLPVLIHMEVAGELYERKYRIAPQLVDACDRSHETGQVIEAWWAWLRRFARFVLRYHALCERDLLLQQCLMAERMLPGHDRANEPQERLVLLSPDIAYQTLGVTGHLRLERLARLCRLIPNTEQGVRAKNVKPLKKAIHEFCEEIDSKLEINGMADCCKAVSQNKIRGANDPSWTAELVQDVLQLPAGTIFGDVERSLVTAARFLKWIKRELL